jgi:hypothetical protein
MMDVQLARLISGNKRDCIRENPKKVWYTGGNLKLEDTHVVVDGILTRPLIVLSYFVGGCVSEILLRLLLTVMISIGIELRP